MSNINQGASLPSTFIDGMPIGSVTAYVGNSVPPAGWLWLRKARLKKTNNPQLYGVIGDVFNDGSQAADEFMLPDADGYFHRQFDSTGLIDPGRVFGSKQADDNKAHTHTLPTGAPSQAVNPTTGTNAIGGVSVSGSSGGSEARPKNIALNYIIKAAPVYTSQQLMAAGQQFVQNPASEGTDGTVKIATALDMATGTDDWKAVTVKKLKLGFSALLGANGYLVFPTWLGGLIIQWYKTPNLPPSSNSISVPYPMVFPTAVVSFAGMIHGTSAGQIEVVSYTLSGAVFGNGNTGNSSNPAFVITLGY